MGQAFLNSPLGWLRAVSTPSGLRSVQFVDRIIAGVATGEEGEGMRLNAPVLRQLTEYFEGRRRSFDLPLVPEGTPFQREVWAALLRIPFGETRSYGEIAREIGRPGAARAVGMANHQNPIAIIVPCHRVIGSDGSLTGYAGGVGLKARLLVLEGAAVMKGPDAAGYLPRGLSTPRLTAALS
jgi:methylated-DNA-[protein]-cysteine S-methyltransferase